jgi:penicillin-insensitive murein endopeptidase
VGAAQPESASPEGETTADPGAPGLDDSTTGDHAASTEGDSDDEGHDIEESEGPGEEPTEGGGEHGDEEGAYAEAEAADLSLAGRGATAPEPPRPAARSLEGLTRIELLKLIEKEPASLGPLSVGLPNSGRLFNAVPLPESKLFHLVSPNFAWGTQETVDYLTAATRRVHEKYPNTPPLFVGHLSSKSGGHLRPHLSHQSGRDVDLGFYYVDKPRWYTRATAENLDIARTWALVRALIVETDVEMILVDQAVIELMRPYALAQGEDPEWVQGVFSSKNGGRGIVRHVRGHRTHLHIRFFNPDAQKRAQRLYPLLVEKNLVPPVTVYATFRAKKGDTLGKIAKKYGSSVEELKRANGLKKSLIVAGRVYKIPRRGGPRPVEQSLSFPPRYLPKDDKLAKEDSRTPSKSELGKAPNKLQPAQPSARASKSK